MKQLEIIELPIQSILHEVKTILMQGIPHGKMFQKWEVLNMKNDKEILFDDNETRDDLLIKDMTPEEIEAEYKKIFG